MHDTVATVISSINTRNREEFFSSFINPSEVQLTDDGNVQDLNTWAEREVFAAQNNLEVTKISENGLRLEGNFTSAQWGTFQTYWNFTLDDSGKVLKLDVGAL